MDIRSLLGTLLMVLSLGYLAYDDSQPIEFATGAAVVNHSVGVTTVAFAPTSGYSKDVEATGQLVNWPLFIATNITGVSDTLYIRYGSGSESNGTMITGFTLKCAPYYNKTGIINVTNSYQLLANGSPTCSSAGTSTLSGQETATAVGGCGTFNTGTYSITGDWDNPQNVYDGFWGTFGIATLTPGYIYVTYPVPIGANLSSSVWTVKDSAGTGAYTLSSYPDCISDTLKSLQFQIASNTFQITDYVHWSCMNVSNVTQWILVRNSTATTMRVYEENMTWNITNNIPVWCWADFNNPRPRGHTNFTIGISEVP